MRSLSEKDGMSGEGVTAIGEVAVLVLGSGRGTGERGLLGAWLDLASSKGRYS